MMSSRHMFFATIIIGVIPLVVHAQSADRISNNTYDLNKNTLSGLNVGAPAFVENQGQWPESQLLYLLSDGSVQVGVMEGRLQFQLVRPATQDTKQESLGETGKQPDLPDKFFRSDSRPIFLETRRFSLNFLGAAHGMPTGGVQATGAFNYYVGDSDRHRSNVPAYESLWFKELYPGIDLELQGHQGGVKYNFHVAPGADWRTIRMQYDGIRELHVQENGALEICIAEGWNHLTDAAPYIYQRVDGKEKAVAGHYVLSTDGIYGIEIAGDYDPALPLVIDPEIKWGSYLGGTLYDNGISCVVDGEGSIIVVGHSGSSGWVSGGGDTSHNGKSDIYVVKMNASGSHVWSTFVGDAGDEFVYDVVVDGSNNILLAGQADKKADDTDLPLTHAYICKLTSIGQTSWIKRIADTDHATHNRGLSVCTDSNNYVYLLGMFNFIDTTYGFSAIAKYDAAGTLVGTVYVKYNVLAMDLCYSNNAFYVVGAGLNTSADIFAVKLSTAFAELASCPLGGSSDDWATNCVVDGNGCLHITGVTYSSGWALRGYDTSHGGGRDAFAAKLTTGFTLDWASYLGGSSNDSGYGIAIDGNGGVIVVGQTASSGWTSGGWDTTLNGEDGFIAKLSSSGSHLWSSYAGGTGTDFCNNGAFSSPYTIFVVGGTTSSGWLSNGWDSSFGGETDGFAVKIEDAYTLSLSKGGTGQGQVRVNGTARSLPYTQTFVTGATVTLEAVASGGSAFSGWSGALYGMTNPTSLLMSGARNVTASFTLNDTTPPVITVVGNNPATHECGATYTDAGATAMDTVDGNITSRITVSGLPSAASSPGQYTVRYTVSDTAGNDAEATRIVNVVDTTPPVISRNGSAAVSLECLAPYTDAGATASDSCDGTITSRIVVTGAVNSAVPGTYILKYNVTDAAQNAAVEVTRTVTVQDTAAPTITRNGPASVTVECGSVYADAGATANDACDGNLTTQIITTNPVNTSVPGIYTVRYEVSDSQGNNAAAVTRTVTVQDTTAPRITQCAQNRSVEADVNCQGLLPDFTSEIVAEDDCSESSALTVSQQPSVGTVMAAGIHDVVVTVRDTSGNTGECTVKFTVMENVRPVITQCATSQELWADETCMGILPDLTGTIVAQDNCTAVPQLTIVQSPAAGAKLALGTHTVEFTVSDAAGNSASCTTSVSVLDKTGPVISFTAGDALQAQCSLPLTLPIATAMDACDGNVTATATDVDGLVLENPAVGVYEVVYAAEDGSGNETTKVLTVTVADTLAPAVSITGGSTLSGDCGTALTLPGATAMDACNGAVTATLTDLNGFNAVHPDFGQYQLTYSALDAAGNVGTAVLTVTITDAIAPTIQCPEPKVIAADNECKAIVPDLVGEAIADDNCTPADALTITQDPAAGETLSPGTHTIEFTVVDAAGNPNTCTTSVSVVDNTGPEISFDEGDVLQAQCSLPLTLPTATAVDACDGNVTATATDLDTLVLENPAVGVYEVVYAAEDGSGNETKKVLTVTVADTLAPLVSITGGNTISGDCGTALTLPGATAMDACDGAVTATLTDLNGLNANSPDFGQYQLTYSALDAAGKVGTAVLTVTITDAIAPTLQCPETKTITADHDGQAVVPNILPEVTAEDACTAVEKLKISQQPEAGSQVSIGGHLITVTVEDDAGNKSECETNLTVNKWPWRYGDANLDKAINLGDVREIMAMINRTPDGSDKWITADVNHDGAITEADMLLLAGYVRSGGIVADVPQGLMAQSGVNEIILLWGPVPHDNVRGYVVERRVQGQTNWVQLQEEVSDAVFYDQNIESVRYEYRVAVVDILGNIETFSAPPVEVLGNTLTLWAPVAYGKSGDEIIAPVGIGSTRGLNPKNVYITVNYDPDIAEYKGILTTVLSATLSTTVETLEPGVLTIFATAPSGRLPVGEGRFFDIRMKLKSGVGDVCRETWLSDVIILNMNNDEVATNPLNGNLCVGDARWGDVDGDGVVTVADAQLLLEFAVRLQTPSATQLFLGDLNGDRRLDAADAVLILRMANNMDINPDQTGPQKNAVEAFGNRRVYLTATQSAPQNCQTALEVRVDNALAMAGMDVVISYTRSDLRCDRICPGKATAKFGFKTSEGPGYARISISDAVALPQGDTVLAYLVFAAIGEPTNAERPAPKVRINYVELKGELGESFRWYGDIVREDAIVTIVPSAACETIPDCDALAGLDEEGEGEGESGIEGEGEGEVPIEGESEGEGETQPEEEGEGEGEGEPEEDDEAGCLGGCAKGCNQDKIWSEPMRLLGDWLLAGVSLITLLLLSQKMRSG